MINRQNWLDIRLYLRHVANVIQNSPETVDRTRAHLRHLLEWADATALTRAAQIVPAFPAYLADRHLSPSSIKKGLESARSFFEFARGHWPQRYHTVRQPWIDLLRPPRGSRMDSRLPVHQYFTLDAVKQIASVSVETLRQERARAAACFLFLSGMRADAFASLPISCVDLDKRAISQLPELGVRTKNRKAGLTYLLDIPELMAVVERWHRRLLDLPPASLWYSPISRDSSALAPATVACIGRGDVVGDDLRIICALAGVAYLSPHKLRHGHVVYGLKAANSKAEWKAVSQNVMHSSLEITDRIYGRLVDDDVRNIITTLGTKKQLPSGLPAEKLDELIELLKQATGQAARTAI
mgnify:CR=1 FL=1